MAVTKRDILKSLAHKRDEIDGFFDRNVPGWDYFDAELGYLLRDCMVREGWMGAIRSHITNLPVKEK